MGRALVRPQPCRLAKRLPKHSFVNGSPLLPAMNANPRTDRRRASRPEPVRSATSPSRVTYALFGSEGPHALPDVLAAEAHRVPATQARVQQHVEPAPVAASRSASVARTHQRAPRSRVRTLRPFGGVDFPRRLSDRPSRCPASDRPPEQAAQCVEEVPGLGRRHHSSLAPRHDRPLGNPAEGPPGRLPRECAQRCFRAGGALPQTVPTIRRFRDNDR